MTRSSGRPGSLDIEPGRFRFERGIASDPDAQSLSFRETPYENGQERRLRHAGTSKFGIVGTFDLDRYGKQPDGLATR